MSSYVIVLVPFLIIFIAFLKKIDIFSAFSEGVKEGIKTSVSVFTPLLALVMCVNMLSSSGFFDLISALLSPILSPLGFPLALIPLALIKPFSGSGSLAVFKNIIEKHGVNSPISEAAAIICAASETTFYTISVYFGAVKIKRTAYTLPCALFGDFLNVLLSVVFVYLL